MKQNRLLLILSVLAFFSGLFYGRYVQQTALSSKEITYSLTVNDLRTGESVIICVQRFDDQTFQVTTSTGSIYASRVAKNGNSLTIDLPDGDGKLSLQSSILPWGSPTLTLFRSDKYETVEGSLTIASADPLDSLEENQLSNDSPQGDNKILKNISMTSEQVDEAIASFGDWLYTSRYGDDGVVVREKFDEIKSESSSVSQIYSFDVDNLSILARVIGNEATNVAALKKKATYNVTLLGNNISGNSYDDFQSTATFRVYQLSDGTHAYFSDQASEYTDLVAPYTTSYETYYQTRVDSDVESYQIVLASNGCVYYTKDYWLEGELEDKPTYLQAPDDMQAAFTAILSQYATASDKEN